MDVRLARPTDAPLVLGLVLDEEAHLVKSAERPAGNPALRTLLRACLPYALPGRLWVGQDGPAAGLLEALPRRYVIGWDVTRMAVRGDREAAIAPAVQAATNHLRSRGVPRLFARCQEDAAVHLKTSGFHPLARELVLVRPDGPVTGEMPLPVDSRYRMPQDAWPLHQLESEITPALVRQMEGLTSMDWSHHPKEMSEIVVERDGKLVCWIGWGVKLTHDLYQIGMLVHRDYQDSAPGLLLYVLKTAPGLRFEARVRDYQYEALECFLQTGFQIVSEEILMMKHARVEAARVTKKRLHVARAPVPNVVQNGIGRYAPGQTAPSIHGSAR
ncbi:MAG: hypothetical protein ACRDFX_08905 [Chloroflexota bacterium]